MAEHKNQHFVPQFYLRFFRHSDSEKLVGTFRLRRGPFVPRVSINTHACDDYFYGRAGLEQKFQKIEAAEVEDTPAAEVVRLEDALNHNLAALAGAKHFEQTVLSLAAAVNMLSARLAETPNPAAPIKLEPMRRTAHAA